MGIEDKLSYVIELIRIQNTVIGKELIVKELESILLNYQKICNVCGQRLAQGTQAMKEPEWKYPLCVACYAYYFKNVKRTLSNLKGI
jgi:hypothetical protein